MMPSSSHHSQAGAVKRMVITNDLKAAKIAEDQVLSLIQQSGYSEESVFAVKLALEEALTNAIKHGNAGDPAKTVTIEYSIAADRVVIVVSDQGKGFIPDTVPDPTADENLECPSGRGIMLMRAYMDEVEYSPAGNTVRMIKFNG